MTLRFGTDGVRGVALTELTSQFVASLGRAAAHVVGSSRWVVGRTEQCRMEIGARLPAAMEVIGHDIDVVQGRGVGARVGDADLVDARTHRSRQQQTRTHSIKLAAGDMVVYPATSLHQVAPITRGVRTSCFFWVQSLIRDDSQRALLYEMDGAIQRLNQTNADETARRSLIGCYHNLVRQWSET
jgi:hypothetical protein